eukprot:GCRY01005054.1.p1 GENE.GCRY01005054.1~~GCRY01005054.1.p1  ORF type:complete len:239 (+),score=39.52 GCRY01005054.1:647-1363(+)
MEMISNILGDFLEADISLKWLTIRGDLSDHVLGKNCRSFLRSVGRSRLRTLDISNNLIGDAMGIVLSAAIAVSATLESVYMDGNHLTEVAYGQLCKDLRRNARGEGVFVWDIPLPYKDVWWLLQTRGKEECELLMIHYNKALAMFQKNKQRTIARRKRQDPQARSGPLSVLGLHPTATTTLGGVEIPGLLDGYFWGSDQSLIDKLVASYEDYDSKNKTYLKQCIERLKEYCADCGKKK